MDRFAIYYITATLLGTLLAQGLEWIRYKPDAPSFILGMITIAAVVIISRFLADRLTFQASTKKERG